MFDYNTLVQGKNVGSEKHMPLSGEHKCSSFVGKKVAERSFQSIYAPNR